MEKMRWIKKGIGALLALNMVLSSVPLPAYAAGSDNLCDHHPVHTAECHYAEGSAGSACTHEHSEDCYKIVGCLHTCGEDCEDPCTHECTVENGCVRLERDCHHVHGDCGYSEGTAEVPCGHVHDENCGYVEVVYEVLCGCAETDEGGNLIHAEGCGYVAPVEGVACGHVEHTDCGYAPATEGTPCNHVCEVKVNSADSCYKLLCSHKDGGHDNACGYAAYVEAHECHYECAECAVALTSEDETDPTTLPTTEPTTEPTTAPTTEASEPELVCTCESDDPDWHAPFCDLYVVPENPRCYCVEKCGDGAFNEWCEVCYFDPGACWASGEEEAVVYPSTPTYIASIGIAQDASSGSTGVNDCKKELSGHTIIDRDLNDGAGGDYVYIGYKTTTDPSKAITGILFRVGENPPDRITDNGKAYFYLVGGSYESNTASEGGYIDLNAKAGGDYIYMYVTRDSSYGAPLTTMTVDENSSKSGYTTGTNTSGSVIDLNQNAGGDYLYLHYKRFSETVNATYYYLDAGGSRTSSTQSATVKNHLETLTKVPSYPTSVTYDGRTFTFKGWREDNTADAATVTAPSVTYITGDKTYRAVYSANVKLSYDANGGSGAPAAQTAIQYINAGYASTVAKQSVRFTIPDSTYTHPSKCFMGLATRKTATTAAYQPGDSITISSDTVLYAVYKDHSFNSKGICTVCGALDHTCRYTNGFCYRCDGYETPALANGYYQITNGGNLFWFAEYINTVDRTASAKLTADIDLENRAWTPIGSTGEGNNNFRGHFDGQGYSITGLNVNANRAGAGFFGEVRLGTVENFTIRGTVTVTAINITYVGGVIGSAPGANSDQPDHNGATIRNITSYVNVTVQDGLTGVGRIGGFMGYANHETIIEKCAWYGTLDLGNQAMTLGAGGFIGRINEDSAVTIRNCGAYGSIVNEAVTENVGAFMGLTNSRSNTVIENCLFAGGVTGANASAVTPFGTWNGASKTLTNSYYINTLGTTDADATAVTPDQLASGEVAYKLGAAWGQTIGSNAYPILGGQKVYCGYGDCKATEVSYANSPLPETMGDSYDANGFCTVCDAYEPATGSGTETDPYKISNAGQLYWFAAVVNDGYGDVARNASAWAELTANITDNETVLNADGSLKEDTFRDWAPIGKDGSPYAGTFDGKEFTVSGLYVNSAAAEYVGLVGYMKGGTLRNVSVADSYLSAYSFVGGVVGRNSNGSVTNCHNSGTVNGSYDYVGGVMGYNDYGSITNCHNSGVVIGNDYMGGVVGRNLKTLENCHNTGIVSGSNIVGGVVGENKGPVENCYNTGAVTGSNYVGGVAGSSGNTVTGCYNTGAVTGSDHVGGVLAHCSGTVANCHNTGAVSGSQDVGGVVGYLIWGTALNSYFDSAVYSGNAIGKNYKGTTTDVLGKTGAQFASGEVAYLLSRGFTQGEGDAAVTYPGDVWGQNLDNGQEAQTYPVLSDARVYTAKNCLGQPYGYSNTEDMPLGHIYENGFCRFCDYYQSAAGSGTESDPYQISNAGQLYWFAAVVNEGYGDVAQNAAAWAELTANITINEDVLGDRLNINGRRWTCAGSDSNPYIGTFDGKNFVISGLVCIAGDDSYMGLFGCVGQGGTVRNVGLVDFFVRGHNYVAAVAGCNYGTVAQCYGDGRVEGNGSDCGSLVGCNYGTVTKCYNKSFIGSSERGCLGGVVGYNYGTITDSYNEGEILSPDGFAGGVAYYNKGTITNCYNAGSLSGSTASGVVITNYGGTVANCYNIGSISGDSDAGGVIHNNDGIVTNCYNAGPVSGKKAGGVVEINTGTIANCYSIGTVSGNSLVGGVACENDGSITNSYHDSDGFAGEAIVKNTSAGTFSDVMGKTTAQFASGEVAYSLDKGGIASVVVGWDENREYIYEDVFYPGDVWGQNIDGEGQKDAYPIFSDVKVFAALNCDGTAGAYSNTQGVQKDHIYENGFCTFCDGYESPTGSGTIYDPYKISNAGQLYWFAAVVNTGYGDVAQNAAAWAVLTDNITVNTGVLAEDGTLNEGTFRDWTSIGNLYKTQYSGTFDGKGFTVGGMYVNRNTNYVGLFGYIYGTVKNVGIVDSYFSGSNYIGGVVGYNNFSGTVEACYNEGSVSGNKCVGGVVGYNNTNSKVVNCYSTGSVNSSSDDVGGVVGYNYSGTVENCHNTGIVSGSNIVGGVVGGNKTNGKVVNCYNTGSVNGSADYVGGVVGRNDKGATTLCYNEGSVSGSNYVGGVAGYSNSGIVENCYNEGLVNGSADYVGGVVGNIFYATVVNCYNSGNVGDVAGSNDSGNVGGVVGSNDSGTVANCYYDSTVCSESAIDENNGTAADVLGKTTAQFASGEVAYLLSRGITLGEGENAVTYPGDGWGQNLDNGQPRQDHPVISDARVYLVHNCQGNPLYSNTDGDIDHDWSNGNSVCANCGTACTHNFVSGTCTICGAAETLLSVEIAWGALTFTYDDAVDEVTGKEKGWTDNGTGWVKVANSGNTNVAVTYTYETERTDITGSFSDGTNPVTAPVSILPQEIKQIWLILANKPKEALDKTTIGSVKLIIE